MYENLKINHVKGISALWYYINLYIIKDYIIMLCILGLYCQEDKQYEIERNLRNVYDEMWDV